jgi:hypothetical protein
VSLSDRHRQLVIDHCKAEGVSSFSAMLARMIDEHHRLHPIGA